MITTYTLPKDIVELWKKFEEHYGGKHKYSFGISNKCGMFYSISVMDNRTHKAKIDQIDLNLDSQRYKIKWYQMMKEFEHASKTS